MQIIFLMASAYDPHYIRKLRIMRSHGIDVEAYGFVRSCDLTSGNEEDDIKLLSEVLNRNYVKRIWTVYENITSVIEHHGKTPVYYATTFDIACVCKMKRVRYIYGISDIVYGAFPLPLRKLFLAIDRQLINGSMFSVLTSPGFQCCLMLSDKGKNKCIYVKNKLDSIYSEDARPAIVTIKDSIRFGFAGNIRYRTTLDFARLIGESYPCHEFIFWGNGDECMMKEVHSLCKKYSNIKYNGKFKNPEDLDLVYDSIDVMVCNYDTTTINERLLEPNKLYECIYFNTPMIVTSDTYLADRVKELKCGFAVVNDDCSMRYVLNKLNTDILNDMVLNAHSIPASELQEDYSDFFERLNDTVCG